MLPRSRSVVRGHHEPSSNVRRAAITAASTSAICESGAVAITSPVAGLKTSNPPRPRRRRTSSVDVVLQRVCHRIVPPGTRAQDPYSVVRGSPPRSRRPVSGSRSGGSIPIPHASAPPSTTTVVRPRTRPPLRRGTQSSPRPLPADPRVASGRGRELVDGRLTAVLQHALCLDQSGSDAHRPDPVARPFQRDPRRRTSRAPSARSTNASSSGSSPRTEAHERDEPLRCGDHRSLGARCVTSHIASTFNRCTARIPLSGVDSSGAANCRPRCVPRCRRP